MLPRSNSSPACSTNRTWAPPIRLPLQLCGDKLRIRRIDSGDRRYLQQGSAIADRPAFTAALLAHIDGARRPPDVIHAHFADAAEVAIAIRDRFGIPFIYTAHSLGIDKADHVATAATLPTGSPTRIAPSARRTRSSPPRATRPSGS